MSNKLSGYYLITMKRCRRPRVEVKYPFISQEILRQSIENSQVFTHTTTRK
jgi:hypothetical protein